MGRLRQGASAASPGPRAIHEYVRPGLHYSSTSPTFQERPEFVECNKFTGVDPFLARLVVHSIEQMHDVLEVLSEHAVTSTAVIKGTSVKRRRLPPL